MSEVQVTGQVIGQVTGRVPGRVTGLDLFACLGLALAVGLPVQGCGSSSTPTEPPTGCAALATCCSASTVPTTANDTCMDVLNEGDDSTCDELLTEYEIDGYCGSAIHVVDGGTGSLGAECGTLLACCSAAAFTGNASDCNAAVYGGSQSSCETLLTTYVSGGKCGGGFDAGG